MRPVSGRLMNWMVFSDFLLQFVQLFIFGSNGAFEVGDNKQQSETDRDFQIDFSGGKIIGNSKHIPIGAGYPKIGNRIIDVEQIENLKTQPRIADELQIARNFCGLVWVLISGQLF